MEHLQSKEDSAQAGVEAAPDPEDTAAQVPRTWPPATRILIAALIGWRSRSCAPMTSKAIIHTRMVHRGIQYCSM